MTDRNHSGTAPSCATTDTPTAVPATDPTAPPPTIWELFERWNFARASYENETGKSDKRCSQLSAGIIEIEKQMILTPAERLCEISRKMTVLSDYIVGNGDRLGELMITSMQHDLRSLDDGRWPEKPTDPLSRFAAAKDSVATENEEVRDILSIIVAMDTPISELREGLNALMILDLDTPMDRGIVQFVRRGLDASLEQLEAISKKRLARA